MLSFELCLFFNLHIHFVNIVFNVIIAILYKFHSK